jgi:hypothetical protein
MSPNDWVKVLLAGAVGFSLIFIFIGIFVVSLNSDDPADFVVSETAITAAFTLMGAIVSGLVFAIKDSNDEDDEEEDD